MAIDGEQPAWRALFGTQREPKAKEAFHGVMARNCQRSNHELDNKVARKLNESLPRDLV